MKITQSQCVILIVMVQLGVGILSLPSLLITEVNSLGWLSVIIAGVFVQILAFVYHFGLKNVEGSNFFEGLEKLSGKVFSKILSIILFMYFIAASASILSNYVYVLNIWAYPETPKLVIVIIIWICIISLSTSKIHSISRVSQYFFIIAVVILSLLLWHFQKFNYNFLRPPTGITFTAISSGVLETSLSLIGFELIFLFFFFLKNKAKTLKILSISNWITISMYLYVVLIVFTLFTPEKLQHLIWPTLSAYKLIEFRFMQRIEYIVTMAWLPLIVITTGVYMWSAKKAFSYVASTNKKLYIFGISLFVPIIAMLPRNHPQVIEFGTYTGYAGVAIAILIPVLLILLKWMK